MSINLGRTTDELVELSQSIVDKVSSWELDGEKTYWSTEDFLWLTLLRELHVHNLDQGKVNLLTSSYPWIWNFYWSTNKLRYFMFMKLGRRKDLIPLDKSSKDQALNSCDIELDNLNLKHENKRNLKVCLLKIRNLLNWTLVEIPNSSEKLNKVLRKRRLDDANINSNVRAKNKLTVRRILYLDLSLLLCIIIYYLVNRLLHRS